jgi:aromatic ring hydroxylase
MARATNSESRPEVAAQLGEIAAYAALTRAAVTAAEVAAHDWGNGAFFCGERPLNAIRALMPGWMVRANEIIKTIGSHNLLATPSLDALEHPEIGPLLERLMPGANGMSARERARTFRAAWDFAGSALGSRTELYERFYLSSAARSFMAMHFLSQTEREWAELPALLAAAGID